MVLVDTSVWVDHFRNGSSRLAALLDTGTVLSHPLVIGELATGNLKARNQILRYFRSLSAATPASHDEVMHLLESHRLMGRGVTWIDLHLVASALLSHCYFWTLDKRLAEVAASIGLPGPGNPRK